MLNSRRKFFMKCFFNSLSCPPISSLGSIHLCFSTFASIFVTYIVLKLHIFLQQDEMRCGVCQREYSSATSLKAHLSKKHRLAMGPCFTCHLCGAIGQTKATLKRHLLRTHGQNSLTEHQMLRKVCLIIVFT